MFKIFMTETSRFCFEENQGGEGGASGGGATGNNGAGAGGANAGAQGGGAPTVAFLPNATPEDVAYVQSKGWDKSQNPAADILQSYRNLEKLNGAVAGGKAIIPPDDNADQAAKDAFFNKLGRPEKVEGYEIKEPFKGMDETLGQGLTKLAHDIGLTKTQLQAVHKWNNEATDNIAKKFEDDYKIENAQQVEKLGKEWGAAYDQNLQVATEAAKAFGITPEQITQLQTIMGYDGVMRFMHNIGKGLGEGSFVTGGSSGGGRGGADNVMTPAQAQAELSRLGTDTAFTKAWMNKDDVGHAAAVAKKSQLSKWAYPQG